MHQQPDSAADGAARKMAHPALLLLPSRAAAGLEEFAPGASVPGPGPPPPPPPLPPPQSLSLAGPAAPQLKKKSGFQITSVTPAAQLSGSLSANNSLAEDTESYDDLDESHTEDLSSSDLLDASLSRHTDPGEPGRSSSEETLSNFQEADTPGALSPNQPRLPGPILNGAPAANASPAAPRRPPTTTPAPAPWRAPASPLPAHLAPAKATTAPPSNGPAAPAAGSMSSSSSSSSAASRFRVVKLDSSSEPFRKGRWTCTEFYDKEGPTAAESRAPDSPRPPPPPTADPDSPGGGGGSSSAASTLSRYTDSLGSGEMAAAGGGLEAGLPPSLPQAQPFPDGGPPAKPPQPLPPYAPQPSAYNPNPNPSPLSGPDYSQPQQRLPAPLAAPQPGLALAGSGAPTPATLAPSLQPAGSAHLAPAPPPPVAGAGAPVLHAAQPGALVAQPPRLLASQGPPSAVPQRPPVSAGVMPPGPQAGAAGLPQTTLLPALSQLPSGEPLVPGMGGQQVPAISPGPAVGALTVSGHCAANVPPPPVHLALSKNIPPPSAAQNESLLQKLPPSSLAPAGIGLPMPPNVPPPYAAAFSAQSLAQLSAGRGEEARRSADPLLAGIGQPLGPESGVLLEGPSSMAASLFPLKGLPLTAQLMDGCEEDGQGAEFFFHATTAARPIIPTSLKQLQVPHIDSCSSKLRGLVLMAKLTDLVNHRRLPEDFQKHWD
ncbi:TSC22 domain family protein 1 isoform X2 [Paroedura picta]|uniref:TSC22 domain family protein 1 isoform X2 n=1 Tax=Paroedura picta TaxID=143630 RepID=UPI004055AFD8